MRGASSQVFNEMKLEYFLKKATVFNVGTRSSLN